MRQPLDGRELRAQDATGRSRRLPLPTSSRCDRLSCRIGTLEALKRTMIGGCMLGGMICRIAWLADGHLRQGRADVGARVEVDLDDRHAVERLRLDPLDVVDVRR